MQLDVILRTHDQGSLHDYSPRIIDVPKAEIVRRCVISLVTALDGVEHTLTILDDHSSVKTCQFLCRQNYTDLISTGPGNNASLLQAVQIARDSRADLVYMIEDDYLHTPNAITEMLVFVELAKTKGLQSVAIHPYDDHDNYTRAEFASCQVVAGQDRHWRTNTYSTGIVLAEPWVFREPEWETLARDYDKPGKNIHEGTTINRIWEDRLPLFTPLPSLAVHLNGNAPPLVDFGRLWEMNATEKEHGRQHLRSN